MIATGLLSAAPRSSSVFFTGLHFVF